LEPLTETEWITTDYHELDGGTGRFTNATGVLDPSHSWIIFTGPTERVTGGVISGTISYDASDRGK
jgi:hypothetical protein